MSDQFEFRGAAIADLIGAPMVAIVEANDMMAKRQVKLLMQSCFSDAGDAYEPIMIAMSIRRGVIDPGDDRDSMSIRQIETSFQVPLITLLPINSLAIEGVDVGFDVDIQTYQEVDDGDDTLFGNVSSSRTRLYELAGKIGSGYRNKTESTDVGDSRTSAVSINVSTSSLPLPLGVSTILQVYSKSIYPLDTSQNQNNDEK